MTLLLAYRRYREEDFADVLLDVLPEQIADKFQPDNLELKGSFLLGADVDETAVLAASNTAEILIKPGVLDEAQQASFDTLINNRIAQLEAVDFDPNFIAGQRGLGSYDFQGPDGSTLVDPGPAAKYREIKEGMEREGILSPYEYFTTSQFAILRKQDLSSIINHDPATFSFIAGRPRPLGQDADALVPLSETPTDVSVMLNRAMRNNITKNYLEAAESRIPRPVAVNDSIRQMDEKINDLPISTERKRELGQSFKTWISTINDPEGMSAYRPSSPFENKNASRDFNQYTPRLILQEVEKAGFDGVIFPNWEDMRDVGARSSVPNQEIYGSNIKKGLSQAGLKPNDIEVLPTIVGKNFRTGSVEAIIHPGTTMPHREAQAVYFDKNRIKTKRYPPDHPQAGETYEENLGSIRDMFAGRLIRRAKGGEVDLRPRKLVHSGIGAMAKQVM